MNKKLRNKCLLTYRIPSHAKLRDGIPNNKVITEDVSSLAFEILDRERDLCRKI